jgi:hypothetical protein
MPYFIAAYRSSIPKKALDEIKAAAKEQNLAVGDYLIKRLGL